MLPGLNADFNACRIGGITISRIEYEEFILLEKSKFSDDLQDVFVHDCVPYYLVFSSYDADQGREPYRSNLRAQQSLRIARSLWLLKEGTLYNPLEFIHYKRTGNCNQRNPNIYGRLGYSMRNDYELSSQELPLLEGIYYALSCFDETRFCHCLGIAEFLFRKTYTPALFEAKDIFLLLLGSLEALVGNNVEQLAKIPWPIKEQRTLLEGFRVYRNSIAHGKQSVNIEYAKALREIVRCLIREALIWAIENPGIETIKGNRFVEHITKLGQIKPERIEYAKCEYPEFSTIKRE